MDVIFGLIRSLHVCLERAPIRLGWIVGQSCNWVTILFVKWAEYDLEHVVSFGTDSVGGGLSGAHLGWCGGRRVALLLWELLSRARSPIDRCWGWRAADGWLMSDRWQLTEERTTWRCDRRTLRHVLTRMPQTATALTDRLTKSPWLPPSPPPPPLKTLPEI